MTERELLDPRQMRCRMCGSTSFSLFTWKAQPAVKAVTAFFGLVTFTPANPALPERLVGTCLRCNCEHTHDEMRGKVVGTPFENVRP